VPIYEYQCRSCESKFEKLLRSMGEDSPVKCPKCGSGKTQRQLSTFAVGAASAPSRPAQCEGCPGGGSCPMQ